MGGGDQIVHFSAGQRLLCQDAAGGKIHQSRHHQLDKIRPRRFSLRQQGVVLCQVRPSPADEAAVVALLVDGECRGTVDDAVLQGQLSGPQAYAEPVAAIPEIGDTGRLIGGQPAADQRIVRVRPVGGNGSAPVRSGKQHMNMQISKHGHLLVKTKRQTSCRFVVI